MNENISLLSTLGAPSETCCKEDFRERQISEPDTKNSIKIAIRIRLIYNKISYFFVLCSTHDVCVQKWWSISPWCTLFSGARIYFSRDNYSTNEEDFNNRKQNKHT